MKKQKYGINLKENGGRLILLFFFEELHEVFPGYI
jgi:hypothetical protein